MSRQSDIKALKNLKDMLDETAGYIKISENELEKYKACEKELTTTKFVFEPLPTNHEENAIKKCHNEWVEKYSNRKPIIKKILLVYNILMILFSVAVLADLFLSTGIVFTNVAELKEIWSAPIFIIALMFIVHIAFSFTLIYLPNEFVGKLIPLGVIALALEFYIFKDYGASWAVLVMLLAFALVYFSKLFVLILYNNLKKKPKLNAEQKLFVAEEKKKDDANAKANIEKEIKDKEEWQKWWDVQKFKIDAQMDEHMEMAISAIKKAEELNKKVEKSDVVGPKEKHQETLDWLIYILEGHRADNIKEALQQYDIMQHNEKMLEIEREKYNLEVQRVRQEHEDRERAMQQQRYHQMRMEAEARRSADMQSQAAASAADLARSAEKARRDAAFNASMAADLEQQIAGDIAAIRRNNYYNS